MSLHPFDTPIPVTRPNLPPIAAFTAGLAEIWDSRYLSNNGPQLQRFAAELLPVVGTPQLRLFANGALALEAALSALPAGGEVITTPFTFVATGNAILRCGLRPVFVDIAPATLTLDPAAVAAAVGPASVAILGVHVFGTPCDDAALAAIARRHGLTLLYDAAHAFGVEVGGRPIGTFGDISMFSLHATKPFQAVEGGALAYADAARSAGFDAFANHGMDAGGIVHAAATNAKMSELHALMGRLMLAPMPAIRTRLAALDATYRAQLAGVDGITIATQPRADVVANFGFMPILVDPAAFGVDRDALQRHLARYNVLSR